MITLRPIAEETAVDAHIRASREAYVLDYAAAHRVSPEDAQEAADAIFSALHQEIRDGNDGHALRAIEEDGIGVGRLWYSVSPGSAPREAFLFELVINPDLRRRGVATAALALLEAEVRAEGVSVLRLHAFEDNLPAIDLYRRAGFGTTDRHMAKWVR